MAIVYYKALLVCFFFFLSWYCERVRLFPVRFTNESRPSVFRQVPEPVPTSVLAKDATPSSINAIFSPPINQFEYSSPTVPTYNPFDGESPLAPEGFDAPSKMDTEEALTPASLDPKVSVPGPSPRYQEGQGR